MNFERKTMDLFHPFIIVLMFVLFLALAMPMWYFYNELPQPDLNLFLYIALGLLFFVFGIFLSNFFLNRFNKGTKNIGHKVSNSSFDYHDLINDNIKNQSLKNPERISIREPYSKMELALVAIVMLGIVLQIINILHLGGIPLFSATLKARAASKIWLFSYIIFLPFINILLAKYNRSTHYLLLVLGLLLFAMTGYRTTPIAILLSVFITLFYTRDIKLKHQIIFIAAIVVVLLAVGFIAVQAISWQNWSLNPIELLSYRAAFTLNILSQAINHQFATMGSLFYSTLTGFFTSTDPRVLVGIATINRNHSITSTLLGPALLDFGIIGMIIQMFALGFILKTLHGVQKYKKEIFAAFYGILLAQTIIWIETGPTDLVVWLFYFAGMVLLIKHFLSNSDNMEESDNEV